MVSWKNCEGNTMRAAYAPLSTPLIVRESLHTEALTMGFAGGHAAILSCRSPNKTTNNEDSAAAIPVMEGAGVLAVADGVGGQRAGDRASAEALLTMAQTIEEGRLSGNELRTSILNGIERANRRIQEIGIGAGTTLAAIEIKDSSVRPYHVGDSFVLVVGQRGVIRLETIPHSPTGYAVMAGLLDGKDALLHKERHLINNMLGSQDMRIELGSALTLRPKDTVLLGSDGLSDNLNIEEIVEIIRKGPLEEAS
ncbi:MAG TPA: protein phosphatase 2C domain-containing protein, partial [Planctomycetota bacterium]|nr:protein phosphatase 2C domain-containing protein [Planctomycetota bacterium]